VMALIAESATGCTLRNTPGPRPSHN
jgi:hypothetical protein